jgi:hypothetical protein
LNEGLTINSELRSAGYGLIRADKFGINPGLTALVPALYYREDPVYE